jgi:hypothetical protein
VIRLAALVAGAAVIGVLHHFNVFEALAAAAPPNTVVFDSGFEDAAWDGWQQTGDGKFALDATRAHTGAQSARLEIRRDGHGGGARAEVVPIAVRGHYRGSYPRYHEEYWYRFSIFLAADWEVDDTPESIAQWHDVPDLLLGEGYRNPPLAIVLRGARVLIESRWDASLVTASEAPGRPLRYDGDWAIDIGDVHDLVGRWCDWTFCVRWEWASDGGGYVRVWRDGALVVDRAGPNCFHDLRGGPYLKLGPYKWPWKGHPATPAEPLGRVTERVLWVDDVSISRGR